MSERKGEVKVDFGKVNIVTYRVPSLQVDIPQDWEWRGGLRCCWPGCKQAVTVAYIMADGTLELWCDEHRPRLVNGVYMHHD